MCSRDDIRNADTYDDLNGKHFAERTNDSVNADFIDAKERGALHTNSIHTNGIGRENLYKNFPYFQSAKMLVNCSSHDMLEGCCKLYLKLIVEHLVKCRWFSWEDLEKLVKEFPFRGTDCNSRPPVPKAKKMKIKASRKIIGTFAEISTFVRSFTQILFDCIKGVII